VGRASRSGTSSVPGTVNSRNVTVPPRDNASIDGMNGAAAARSSTISWR
jgi:hypothetical protein